MLRRSIDRFHAGVHDGALFSAAAGGLEDEP